MAGSGIRSGRRPLVAGVLGALLGAALVGGCSRADAPPDSAAAGSRQSYIKVEAVGADGQGLGASLPARIAFRPGAQAAVGTPFAGRVLAVAVQPGQMVAAGAPLVTLQSAEAADARSAFAQAQARLLVAQDALRRQADMVARGIGIEVERYSAEVAVREATADVERARQSAALAGKEAGARLVLRAPGAGVVLNVNVRPGAVLAAGGEALVEIGDASRLWVVADAPERELAGLAPGAVAQVRVPAIDAVFDAAIHSVGHAVDAEQRRMPVYLTMQNEAGNGRLAAGMFAQVALQSAPQGALSLPVGAVLIKNGAERQVYLQREDGTYAPQKVRTGVSRAGRVEILEGLQAGDRVVVQGALLLDSDAQQLL